MNRYQQVNPELALPIGAGLQRQPTREQMKKINDAKAALVARQARSQLAVAFATAMLQGGVEMTPETLARQSFRISEEFLKESERYETEHPISFDGIEEFVG